MIKRPEGMSIFEFVVLAGLRASQLRQGCVPRVPESEKVTVTAQQEVAQRKVCRSPDLVVESAHGPVE
jgi:DNA-directed RNA polymerase subunit K/omega